MDIEQARKECRHVYLQLQPIAKEAVEKYSKPIDTIVKEMSKLESMTDEEIRQLMMRLSIECYFFGNHYLAEREERKGIFNCNRNTGRKDKYCNNQFNG